MNSDFKIILSHTAKAKVWAMFGPSFQRWTRVTHGPFWAHIRNPKISTLQSILRRHFLFHQFFSFSDLRNSNFRFISCFSFQHFVVLFRSRFFGQIFKDANFLFYLLKISMKRRLKETASN